MFALFRVQTIDVTIARADIQSVSCVSGWVLQRPARIRAPRQLAAFKIERSDSSVLSADKHVASRDDWRRRQCRRWRRPDPCVLYGLWNGVINPHGPCIVMAIGRPIFFLLQAAHEIPPGVFF